MTATPGDDRTNPIRFTHRFREDFYALWGALDSALYEDGPPFAFSRFADGEIAFCKQEPLTRTADGWRYDGSPSDFALSMLSALQDDPDGYYLGLSCPCCDRATWDWLVRHTCTPPERITFSNLFVNSNHARFMHSFRQLQREEYTLVASANGDITVPRNAINPPFDYRETLARMQDSRRPIFVAAGPLSCVLIHQYWLQAEDPQPIIDIGSALDVQLHGRATRRYLRDGSKNQAKVCRWV